MNDKSEDKRMNQGERYIQAVLHNVTASPPERRRIEADLRAHLSHALESEATYPDVVTRMGEPEEVAAAFMAQVDMHYAGFWRRLGAFMIDMALLLLVVAILGIFALLANNLVPPHPDAPFEYIVGGLAIAFIIGSALVILSAFLLYFPLLEGRFGQTLGKRLLGMHVLKENGLPIGFREAFLRRLSYYFEFLPVDALFIPFNEKCQRGFDIIAQTVVIREK